MVAAVVVAMVIIRCMLWPSEVGERRAMESISPASTLGDSRKSEPLRISSLCYRMVQRNSLNSKVNYSRIDLDDPKLG